MAISCLLIRINGAINEKMVSISAKLTVKRLDITLLLESIELSKNEKREEKEIRLKITKRRDEEQYHGNNESQVETKFVCDYVVL